MSKVSYLSFCNSSCTLPQHVKQSARTVISAKMNKLVAFLFVLCFAGLPLSEGQPSGLDVGSSCAIKSSRSVSGTCKPLSECPGAISDYTAGVNPTICTFKNNFPIVCCRDNLRVSAKKCTEYTEVLTIPDGPIPFLPPKFLPSQPMKTEVKCDAPLNGLIVGGRDAKVDELPHMAALGFDSDSGTLWGCGGTLISEDFVLTAAHCIDTPKYGRPKKVLLGDITLDDGTTGSRVILNISEYIKHPEYKPPLSYNDIALLKLDRKVNITRSVLPACLPEPEKRFDRKANVSTAGWGKLGFGEGQSETLQVVQLSRFNQNRCNDLYQDGPARTFKYPNGIQRTQICAGDTDAQKDSCQGDSGGPLTTNLDKRCIHYVIGVTSFGPSYCGSSTPGVYTSVQSYLDWIEDIVWPDDD